MSPEPAALMRRLAEAHAVADAEDTARPRTLSMRQRGDLIESACEAAAVIERSRIAAGMPATPPACWPASTWEFLRKHAARVREIPAE